MSAAIFSAVVLAGCLAALLTAAVIDLKCRIVPNRLVIVIAGGGVALRLLSSPGLIWVSLLVAAAFFVVLGRLSHHDWIGGGDAKLIAAVTLLAPPAGIGKLLFDITLAGGLMSCVLSDGAVHVGANGGIPASRRRCSLCDAGRRRPTQAGMRANSRRRTDALRARRPGWRTLL